MTGIDDAKPSTDAMPNDNEKNCNKSSTRDQGTQTTRDQCTQTGLIFEFDEK